MKTRTQRLLTIRHIINSDKVSNQEELMKRLKKEGYNLTQATLSRDLKLLRAGKIPDKQHGYVYVLPDSENHEAVRNAPDSFPLNGYLSIDFANHLAVMKVLPGYASSIAAAIDDMDSWELMGTIAGDDTILIIPREGITDENVIDVLAQIIPGVKNKFH